MAIRRPARRRARPPAGKTLRTAHQGHDLPLAWLIAEWPPTSDDPIKYWLSNLPAGTPHRSLVRQAKLRWRIEHDYRELKTGLGLDHYEGRTWQGWHHHTVRHEALQIRAEVKDLRRCAVAAA